ncbi:MAG: hypothetical protein WBC90_02220 [Albidovulum sp.]
MSKVKYIAALLCIASLAGCLDNDAERGVAGAAGGALVADALGGNALTGAVIGGAGGVFCDDLGVCN